MDESVDDRGGIYSVTFRCEEGHDGTKCACNCHEKWKKQKSNVSLRIYDDKENVVYEAAIDTSPSSSEAGEHDSSGASDDCVASDALGDVAARRKRKTAGSEAFVFASPDTLRKKHHKHHEHKLIERSLRSKGGLRGSSSENLFGKGDDGEVETTVGRTIGSSDNCSLLKGDNLLCREERRRRRKKKIVEIEDLLDEYPLVSRPYFEARRGWMVSKTSSLSYKLNGAVLDDFYLNLLDWGEQDRLAMASASNLLILKFDESSRDLDLVARFGNNESTIPSDSDFTSVKWSPDGKELAVGTRFGQIEIWDVEMGKIKLSYIGHSHRVGTLDWHPSLHDRLLTSGSRDKTIVTHDLRSSTAAEQRYDRHRQEVCGLEWRRDFSLIAKNEIDSLESTRASVEDRMMEESVIKDRMMENGGMDDLKDRDRGDGVSSDTDEEIERLLSGDFEKAASLPPFSEADLRSRAESAIDTVMENDSQSGCGNGNVNGSLLRSNVNVLASGGNDNKVYIWELGYTAPLVRLSIHTAAVKALAWAPCKYPLLATGGGTNDRTVRIWDAAKGKELATCETESQVCNLVWSPATLELVSSHGYTLNQVNVWNLRSRLVPVDSKPLLLNKVATLTGHTARVLYMSGSKDGRRVATAAGDGSVKIWDTFMPAG